MADDHQLHLTRRERQIMDALYAEGALSVSDVQQRLPEPPTATAVRTLLQILCDKGVAQREKVGREYRYSPCVARDKAGQSALDKVVQVFFDGSFEKAVASYLTQRKVKLSPQQRKQLKAMIDDARRRSS